MGFNSGYITRIDGAEPRPLFTFEPPREPGQEADPGRPRLPITHVVEEDGGLLVLSYSDVFRVDKGLTVRKKFATLEIQYRLGRPDAVGSYPSVTRRSSADPPRRALCPRHGRRRICASGGDEGDLAQSSRPTRRLER